MKSGELLWGNERVMQLGKKKEERNERAREELVLLIMKAHEIKHSVKYFIL